MVQIFNYQCFKTSLDKSTRTLWIELASKQEFITLEFLFELESIFSWLTARNEISSVVIQSENKSFNHGLNYKSAASKSPKHIARILKKVRHLSYSMMHLPQTFIFDLGKSCHGVALELSLGADIRICHSNGEYSFDHNLHGLVPASGAQSILPKIVPASAARNWIMSAKNIAPETLIATGFVSETYSDQIHAQTLKTSLLSCIFKQAPTQRIQSKFAMLESIRPQLEEMMKFEDSLAKAAMINDDWKKEASKDNEFMSAKSMSNVVKLSLIKSQELNN